MGDPALSIVYQCTIDGFIPLGIWTKITGLGFEYKVREYREGGINSHTHKLFGPTTYTNLQLTRPVDSNSQWLATELAGRSILTVARPSTSWATRSRPRRSSASTPRSSASARSAGHWLLA